MPTERVTVHRGYDGDQRDVCWLKLDNVHLFGGLRRETNAQKLAARLNAAMDNTAADERKRAWTKDKPVEPGRYAYLRYPAMSYGEIRQIAADESGKLWVDYGCAGDLPLAEHDEGRWFRLPEIKA